MISKDERRLQEFVDREAEMQRFQKMLDEPNCSIMVIWGSDGVGKSSVRSRMIHECAVRGIRKSEVIWTNTRRYDYLGIMRKMRDDIGVDWFKKFTDLINYFTVPHYELNIKVEGTAPINVGERARIEGSQVGDIVGIQVKDMMMVAPRSDMEIPNQERMIRLTEAFLDCLSSAVQERPIGVFFDAFEKATGDTAHWVWDELLRALRDERLSNITFVLCCTNCPELTGDWRYSLEVCELRPLGHQHVLEYLARRGVAEAEREAMAFMLMKYEAGNMLGISTQVDAYFRQREIPGDAGTGIAALRAAPPTAPRPEEERAAARGSVVDDLHPAPVLGTRQPENERGEGSREPEAVQPGPVPSAPQPAEEFRQGGAEVIRPAPAPNAPHSEGGGGTGAASGIAVLQRQMAAPAQRWLQLCAIPHQFNREILQVLDPALTGEQAKMICEDLCTLSTVQRIGENMMLHDQARHQLFTQWLEGKGDGFAQASACLTYHFERLAVQGSPVDREVAENQAMFHLIGADQDAGFARFERLLQQRRLEFRFSDCATLIRLVHEYDSILDREQWLCLSYHEANLHADHRRWDEADVLYRRVLASPELSPKLRMRTLHRLGRINAERQSWDAAATLYQKALAQARALPGAPTEEYRSLHDLAVAHRETGRLDRAESLFGDALRLAEQLGDRSAQARTHTGIGMLHLKRGDTQAAIASFEKGLTYLDPQKDRFRRAQLYGNLGLAYADLTDWRKSRELLEKSLDVMRQAGDTLGQANTLNNLARVYHQLQEPNKGVAAAEQAVQLFFQMREWRSAAVTSRNLGRFYQRQQRPADAERAFHDAIELFSRVQAGDEVAATRNEMNSMRKPPGIPWWVWLPFALIALIIALIALIILFGMIAAAVGA